MLPHISKTTIKAVPILSLGLLIPFLFAFAQELSFSKSYEISTYYPVSTAIGDLNKDGNMDLVIANAWSNFISVALGNGDGTFSAKNDVPVITEPYSIVIADFNNDNNLDLAVASFSTDQYVNNISVLLGNGDGTFAPQKKFSAGRGWLTSIITADFNEDGNLDLAVANYTQNQFTVLFGDGSGNFANIITFPTGRYPTLIVSEDFNKDGHKDIAVGNYWETYISVYRGDGTGLFSFFKNISTNLSSTSSLNVADVNEDGSPDIIAGGRPLVILLNDSSGDFRIFSFVDLGTSSLLRAVQDFNGDGHLDISAQDRDRGLINFALGNGDGTFVKTINSLSVPLRPRSIVSKDLNGDGNPDLVVSSDLSGKVSIFLNTTPPFLEVNIDIKPGSFPNCINPKSNGSVPVAIFGDNTVDVTEINIASLELAGAAALVKKNGEPQASFEDVNKDGFADLTLHFPVQNLQLTGTETNAELRGKLKTGRLIKGSDNICFSR